MHIFPGTIQVNLVELPDIDPSTVVQTLDEGNRFVKITWPKYYYDKETQGDITWTIVRQDMTSFKTLTRTYTSNSSEITEVGDNIEYIDREIRKLDKYQYTVSGVFNYTSNVTINNISKEYSLSLNVNGFTTDTIFTCFGYTFRFPFGRYNTTSTNLKLFAPKLLKSNVTKETRELFAKQLLITHPNPDLNLYPTDLEWLEYKFPDGSTWPNGLGLCTEVESNTTLASTNQNILQTL